MAEQFLTLMADLDGEAQERLSGWYRTLREAGFTGVQTPGLPYHISLFTFPTDREEEAAGTAERAAAAFAPVPVHFSHIGMFAGGTNRRPSARPCRSLWKPLPRSRPGSRGCTCARSGRRGRSALLR